MTFFFEAQGPSRVPEATHMHTVHPAFAAYLAFELTFGHFRSQGSLKPLIKDSITYFNLNNRKNTSNYNWLSYVSGGFATYCLYSLSSSGLPNS